MTNQDPTIESVLMSLNPAGWVKTLGLLAHFDPDPTLVFEGVQVTKELTERPTVHVRTRRAGPPDVFGPTTITTTRQFVRDPADRTGWKEVR